MGKRKKKRRAEKEEEEKNSKFGRLLLLHSTSGGSESPNLAPSASDPLVVDTQVMAEVWQELDDNGNMNLNGDFDLFEDMRAGPGASLDEFDVDVGDHGDEDRNLLAWILAKPIANRHNDLDDDLNADLDDDGYGASVNLDPFDESDGNPDLRNDSFNDWTTLPLAIKLFNINGHSLLEADNDIVQVIRAMAGPLGETATALQTLDQVIGSIRQQRTDGDTIFVEDGRTVSKEPEGGKEEEEG